MTISEKIILRGQINKVKSKYSSFMGGVTLPRMTLHLLDIEEIKKELSWATVKYNPNDDTYELLVFDQLFNPQIVVNGEYIIFHEFTHALDISLYGTKDQKKYNELRGYLEYHAAQVEMLALLGAQQFTLDISFSLADTVTDVDGEKSVLEYLEHGLEIVNEAIRKPTFKSNMEEVFHAVGALYNHLGRVSVCQLASTDYEKHAHALNEKCPGQQLFDLKIWNLIETVFAGIMTDDQIKLGGSIYYGSLIQLFEQYGIQQKAI